MTPVPGRQALDTPAGKYNQAHASMRAVVERCIGLLKSRFRCLHRHRTLYHHPKVAGTIVAACAVLHNVCLSSGETELEPSSDSDSSSDEDDAEEESPDAARERRGLQSRPLYSQGKAVRDRLVQLPNTAYLQHVRARLRRIRRRHRRQQR